MQLANRFCGAGPAFPIRAQSRNREWIGRYPANRWTCFARSAAIHKEIAPRWRCGPIFRKREEGRVGLTKQAMEWSAQFQQRPEQRGRLRLRERPRSQAGLQPGSREATKFRPAPDVARSNA